MFKVFSLFVRTATKPLITWVTYYKKSQIKETDSAISRYFASRLKWLGQITHYYNTKLNRRFFKISNNTTEIEIKPLSEDRALDRGAEIFGEILIYTILLTLPVFEMIRQYKNAAKKEKIKEDFLANMRKDVDKLVIDNEEITYKIREVKEKLKLL